MIALYKENPDCLYFDTSRFSEDNRYYSAVNGVIKYFQSIFHSDKGIKCQECGITYPKDFFGFIDAPICALCLASHPFGYCKQCGKLMTSSAYTITITNKNTLVTLSVMSKGYDRSVWHELVSNKVDLRLLEYIKDNTVCHDCIKNMVGLKGTFYDKPSSPKFNWLTFDLDNKNMLVFHFFPSIPVKDTLVDIRDRVKPFLTNKINEKTQSL